MFYVVCSSHLIPWMHSIKLTANIVILTLSRSCRSCTNIFIFSRSACSCWWDKISTSSDLGGSSGLLKPACRQEHAINNNNHKITKHKVIHKLLQMFVTHTNMYSPLTQITECIRNPEVSSEDLLQPVSLAATSPLQVFTYSHHFPLIF
jgi:hypothetical protein